MACSKQTLFKIGTALVQSIFRHSLAMTSCRLLSLILRWSWRPSPLGFTHCLILSGQNNQGYNKFFARHTNRSTKYVHDARLCRLVSIFTCKTCILFSYMAYRYIMTLFVVCGHGAFINGNANSAISVMSREHLEKGCVIDVYGIYEGDF